MNRVRSRYAISRGGDSTASTDCALLDIDSYVHHFYGIKRDALVLVRSDGYVGLTAGSFDALPIIDYLHKVSGR